MGSALLLLCLCPSSGIKERIDYEQFSFELLLHIHIVCGSVVFFMVDTKCLANILPLQRFLRPKGCVDPSSSRFWIWQKQQQPTSWGMQLQHNSFYFVSVSPPCATLTLPRSFNESKNITSQTFSLRKWDICFLGSFLLLRCSIERIKFILAGRGFINTVILLRLTDK